MALFFIVLHFILIFFYALPARLSSKTLSDFSKPYVEPIFTQTWAMFAPCPTLNAKIEVNYQFANGDSTGWLSPTTDARYYHSWLRGSHHGELVLGESNLMYWLSLDLNYYGIELDTAFPVDRMTEFHQGYSYYKMRSYLLGNSIYLFDNEPVRGQIRFEIEDVVTGEVGELELPTYIFE